MITTASFGPGGAAQSPYRYTLRRDWHEDLGLFGGAAQGAVMFLMLNPSTADATKDDPTVAKCLRLAQRWGFGALEVRNIFALRSTDPMGLRKVTDPIGPANDQAIIQGVASAELIVAAWGNHGNWMNRGQRVQKLLQGLGVPVHCFRSDGPHSPLTNEHQPAHPLYQPECAMDGLARWF